MTPVGLDEALSASDGAYLFGAIAALLSGAVTLGLRPRALPAGRPAPEPPARSGTPAILTANETQ